MLPLTPDACRVLGTLVEKAQTTPAQYPLSLNSLVAGVNQRSNRDPAVTRTEEQVFDALMFLRSRGLVHEVDLAGSRVAKYRHVAREALGVDTPQLCILAELLLRGPQSAAELRAHASRMTPLDSTEGMEAALRGLMARPEPLVREVPPSPGTRVMRLAQLLCPTLHALDAPRPASPAAPPDAGSRLDRLEAQVRDLRRAVRAVAEAAGIPDPLDDG